MRRLIERKRDGAALSAGDWQAVVHAALGGGADQAQLGALLMACVWRGMDDAETFALTEAMVNSGDVVRFTQFADAVDKHSTGGVGDTASLIVVPVLAAAGAHVAKLSGRALGHTGGTIDKLESIPGFVTALDAATFERIIAQTGCAIAAQSERIVPADKLFYALRDRTGTIPSIGLVTASIVSKKVAGGAAFFAFDVKTGTGAFMKTVEEARALAASLVRTSAAFGRKAVALITDMDEPLSPLIGNALELIAAREFLTGERRPERLNELVRALAVALLELKNGAGAAADVDRVLADGSAARKFEEMIAAQGGDVAAYRTFAPAEPAVNVHAPGDGFVAEIDAAVVGHVAREAVERGGNAAGVEMAAHIGDRVAAGDLLARVHGYHAGARELATAFALSAQAPARRPVVYEVVDSSMLSMK